MKSGITLEETSSELFPGDCDVASSLAFGALLPEGWMKLLPGVVF